MARSPCSSPRSNVSAVAVDKVLGDGILALFGAPVAHEDDPDRAVRAAIEMHRRLGEFVDEQTDLEQQVRLRIGVNTGEVVVGRVSGGDDYTAMGDVVNVASRLQSMAPPGGIYVGSSTEVQLSPSIERVLVAEADLRGRDQTEKIWRVTGRLNRLLPTASPHDRPFVGRNSQRELLSSVMGLVADGNGAVVSVSGEAGSGKTRLVNEALARFPSRHAVVFSGVCAPYGETNVWAPIANALFKLMGSDRAAPAPLLREIVEEKGMELYGFDPADPRLHRFIEGAMHLFGHPSELDRVAPGQAREILMQVVVEGLHRRSQGAPVVVWIDDLQWADPLLLELLGRSVAFARGATRPDDHRSARRCRRRLAAAARSPHHHPDATGSAHSCRVRCAARLGARHRGRAGAHRPALRTKRWQPAVPHTTRRGGPRSPGRRSSAGFAAIVDRRPPRLAPEQPAPPDRQRIGARRDRPDQCARAFRRRDGPDLRQE